MKRIKVTADLAVVSYIAIAFGIGNGYIDGVFVNIKTDKCDTIFHDLPPWLWLCLVNFAFTK